MMLVDLPVWFVLITLFLIGCSIGSFLNVCIHRFPIYLRLRDQLKSLSSHGSGCPRCGTSILWRDNIPLLGWLLLRGRCRNCRRPIALRYPLVELLTGLLFVAVYWFEIPHERFGTPEQSSLFSPDGPQQIALWRPVVWLHARYALHMMMICGLIVASFIDLELRIIPDGSTLPVLAVALLMSLVIGQVHIVPLWFQDESVARVLRPALPAWLQAAMFHWDCIPFAQRFPHLHGLLTCLAGILAGGGSIWMVRILGAWILRQEAMGFGDVVLMAMIGSVIGWQPVLVVFFLAPILGVFAAAIAWILRRDREIPYGPWLSLGALLLILAWPRIWPPGRRVFDMGPLMLLMAVFMVFALVASLQLVQIVRRLLGIQPVGADGAPSEEWTSADHLTYYNRERPDDQTGQWTRPLWPGCRAGQGGSRYHNWRHGR